MGGARRGDRSQILVCRDRAFVQHIPPGQNFPFDSGFVHLVHGRIAVGDVQDIQGVLPYNLVFLILREQLPNGYFRPAPRVHVRGPLP